MVARRHRIVAFAVGACSYLPRRSFKINVAFASRVSSYFTTRFRKINTASAGTGNNRSTGISLAIPFEHTARERTIPGRRMVGDNRWTVVSIPTRSELHGPAASDHGSSDLGSSTTEGGGS